MSLIKKSYLKEIRAKLVKEAGRDIPDEAWNQVVKKVEDGLREKLNSKETKEAIAKAFWYPMYEMAEKGDIIVEIDGVNLGDEIRKRRIEHNRKSCQLIENSKKDENWDGNMSASNSELCKGDCDKCSYNRETPEKKVSEMIK